MYMDYESFYLIPSSIFAKKNMSYFSRSFPSCQEQNKNNNPLAS